MTHYTSPLPFLQDARSATALPNSFHMVRARGDFCVAARFRRSRIVKPQTGPWLCAGFEALSNTVVSEQRRGRVPGSPLQCALDRPDNKGPER